MSTFDDRLNVCAIDESSVDGLMLQVGPVETLLRYIMVNGRGIGDTRYRQRWDYIVVTVVQVDAADLSGNRDDEKHVVL